MKDRYDYLVIGSGPAGHTSALCAAQLGLKVAVVEKDMNMLGGVCLNEGCIPAKSIFHDAKIFNILNHNSTLYGIKDKENKIDLSGVVEKSRRTAEQLKKGLSFVFKKNGVDVITGAACLVNKETVQVAGENGNVTEVKADKILIATGSVSRSLSELPFDGKKVITSSEAIRMKDVPKSILIVGGGAIGTEFASFFNIIGSEVSIMELEDRLLPLEDREISRRLESVFKRRGIKVLTSSKVQDESIIDEYEVILVSVGRKPVTSGMGLEEVGVEIDGRGFIPVDKETRTSVKNIFAVGDVLATPMLAHMAAVEGEIAARAAAGKKTDPIDYDAVPNAVYTEVQVSSVGMTEKQVREMQIEYSVGKQFFLTNGRAVVNSETEGFIKVIADNNTRKLLGVHIVGYEAAELIHEFVVAKKAGLTTDDIGKTIHVHPTFSETAIDACRAVFGKAIHG